MFALFSALCALASCTAVSGAPNPGDYDGSDNALDFGESFIYCLVFSCSLLQATVRKTFLDPSISCEGHFVNTRIQKVAFRFVGLLASFSPHTTSSKRSVSVRLLRERKILNPSKRMNKFTSTLESLETTQRTTKSPKTECLLTVKWL